MSGEMVEFAVNGGKAPGYLTRPASATEQSPKPAVVVIQEWWGLNTHMKDIADRFARAGYVALAPDLYHGKVIGNQEPNEAQKAAMELNKDWAIKEIHSAVTYLLGQTYVHPKKIAVVGFCMGGMLTLYAGAQNPDVAAVSAFYGGGAPKADIFSQSKAAVLNIVGEKDHALKSVQELENGLKNYSLPHELVIYPGCDHAFFNDTRKEVYNPQAAADAWKRTLDWFNKYLA